MEWFVFALGCAILAAFAAVLSKEALNKENAVEFSTALAITNVVVSIPLVYWLNINIQPVVWCVIFFSASLGAGGFLLTAKALRHMEISVISPLKNFSPAFTAFLAFIFLSEQLTLMHVAGISVLILGSYILEIDFEKHDMLGPLIEIKNSKYIHVLFGSLAFYAVSAISGKYALSFANPITVLFLTQLFVAIVFLVYITVFYDGKRDIIDGFENAGKIIVAIAALTVSYRVLQYQAMSMEYVSLVIPIKRMSTLFSTVIGGELFHEEGVWRKSMACVIMILGATLIVLG